MRSVEKRPADMCVESMQTRDYLCNRELSWVRKVCEKEVRKHFLAEYFFNGVRAAHC